MERHLVAYLCVFKCLLFVIKPLYTLSKSFNPAQEQNENNVYEQQQKNRIERKPNITSAQFVKFAFPFLD